MLLWRRQSALSERATCPADHLSDEWQQEVDELMDQKRRDWVE